MTLRSCSREKELREVIDRGQWPLAADASPELHAHVAACRSCSDFVLVAESFRKVRAASTASARLVPPGILWWRAQLRRRNLAVERITRPILGAQIFALAVTVLAGFGFAIFEARQGVAWLTLPYWRDWFAQLPQSAALYWTTLRSFVLTGPGWSWAILVPAAATCLLLAGVAVYMASEKQ